MELEHDMIRDLRNRISPMRDAISKGCWDNWLDLLWKYIFWIGYRILISGWH
jgi:hypothetical protein